MKKAKKVKRGKGFVNSLINNLPFELHLPSYQYCGPGTKLKKRLKRNDPGINELDRACKEHDIAYSQSKEVAERNRADEILASKAWQRFKSGDASLGERAAALGISGVMKAKSAMGAGLDRGRRKNVRSKKAKSGSGLRYQKNKPVSIHKAFRSAVKVAKSTIQKHKPRTVAHASELALRAAKAVIKDHKISKHGASNGGLPRIIPVPKIGGILPLIPIFAGLSALGALAGGSAGIANAVVSANKAKKDYNELKRHNESMEAIALGKSATKAGAGLYLKPYKEGLGLYLAPYSKNIY